MWLWILFAPPGHAEPAATPTADPACAAADSTCDTIVVTASRTEQARSQATAAVQVLDRARLAATGATTLADALRTVPGLQVTATQGGPAVSLRGMDPEHTLVLIDGRPLAGRVDGVVDLSRIALADLDRVEVLPGPASALYGSDAIGGVVNLVTRRGGDPLEAEARVRAGSRALTEASAHLSAGRAALRAGASAYRNAQDGWDSAPEDPATTGDDAGAWGTRAFAQWTPTPAWRVDADGDYASRDTRGVRATGAGAVLDTRALQETIDGSVSARHWNGAAQVVTTRASVSAWRQQALDDQRGSAVQDAYQETVDRRVATNVQAQWASDAHVTVAGVDGWSETLTSDRLATGDAQRLRGAIYVQDDWRWRASGPRVTLAPGARLDVDSQFGPWATPSLALRVDPSEDSTLRASLGRGYRAPDLKELHLALDHASYGYTLAGNADLRPESSWGGNLEATRTLAQQVVVSARASWDEVRDLIQTGLVRTGSESDAAAYGYVNIGRARVRTAGGGAGWVTSGPVTAQVDYLYTDGVDRESGAPLDGRSPHRVTARAHARIPGNVEADVNLEWGSPRPYTLAGVTERGPTTVWLDAQLRWHGPLGATFELGARNALDTRDDAYQGLPPRTLYAGIRAGSRP